MQCIGLAINEGENEVAETRKKSSNSDAIVGVAVEEVGSLNSKNGDGDKSEVKDSAAGTVRRCKPIKLKIFSIKLLLNVKISRERFSFGSCLLAETIVDS